MLVMHLVCTDLCFRVLRDNRTSKSTFDARPYLHEVTDVLPVGQNLAQVLRSEHVSQGGGGQKTGGPRRIFHVGDGYRSVGHPVVDHSIHRHRHGIFR